MAWDGLGDLAGKMTKEDVAVAAVGVGDSGAMDGSAVGTGIHFDAQEEVIESADGAVDVDGAVNIDAAVAVDGPVDVDGAVAADGAFGEEEELVALASMITLSRNHFVVGGA